MNLRDRRWGRRTLSGNDGRQPGILGLGVGIAIDIGVPLDDLILCQLQPRCAVSEPAFPIMVVAAVPEGSDSQAAARYQLHRRRRDRPAVTKRHLFEDGAFAEAFGEGARERAGVTW